MLEEPRLEHCSGLLWKTLGAADGARLGLGHGPVAALLRPGVVVEVVAQDGRGDCKNYSFGYIVCCMQGCGVLDAFILKPIHVLSYNVVLNIYFRIGLIIRIIRRCNKG